jgi:hypothetical protein
MDRIKGLVIEHQDKLKYLILGCAGLAAFNCLTRPDFNMIVYLYIYYMWYVFSENKVNYIYLKSILI